MSLLSTPLCRCICGSTRKDEFDSNRVLDTYADDEPPIQQPEISGYLSYCATTDQPLRGVPIREGGLWLLSAEEEVALVSLSLYVNGFAFTHKGREHSFSLSPFALVRNCKFQATTSEGVDLSDFKCFKVSLFTQGACFYFGVRATKSEEREAEEDRSRWVIDISRAMRLVTQSLFPPFQIACEPLQAVNMTQRRLMAGYLLHHDDVSIASVLYCELHPQSVDHGKLVVYENELCQVVVMEICITERSTCCEKVGISCSCFSIEDHLFSTRTLAERKLWLRAISNVKVKLQNRAPSPSGEELRNYRLAIREHIRMSKAAFQSQAPMDALLHRHPRRSAHAISGDHDVGGISYPPPYPAPPNPPAEVALPPALGEEARAAGQAADKLVDHNQEGDLSADLPPPDDPVEQEGAEEMRAATVAAESGTVA